MNIENINGYNLKDLKRINVIIGKNGAGKSTMMRNVEQNIGALPNIGKSKYVTPERGGTLIYDAGTEHSISSNASWMPEQRRKNQAANFRQQSVAQYRRLKDVVLEEIEKERRADTDYTFDIYIEEINSLLDNIEIRRHENSFEIYKRGTDDKLNPNMISSGESELISLGIECLIFGKECESGKMNLLFLDEPDVHLHPDLQVRLINFLKNLATKDDFYVVIATHSTAILGALDGFSDSALAFVSFGEKNINFNIISQMYKKILPVFGAHPLSNFFNESPILLVEGEDDERIWQQVVRTSSGRIKLYPCSVGSVTSLNAYETESNNIINSVYDDAKGYSLRDRDGVEGEMRDYDHLIRMKLSCRNAENLLLSDESLSVLGVNWSDLKLKINQWISRNSDHSHYSIMTGFRDGGFDRMSFDIKDIRNDIMGIVGSSKPWEIVVGQAIAGLDLSSIDAIDFNAEGEMNTFLGEKVVRNLLSS